MCVRPVTDRSGPVTLSGPRSRRQLCPTRARHSRDIQPKHSAVRSELCAATSAPPFLMSPTPFPCAASIAWARRPTSCSGSDHLLLTLWRRERRADLFIEAREKILCVLHLGRVDGEPLLFFRDHPAVCRAGAGGKWPSLGKAGARTCQACPRRSRSCSLRPGWTPESVGSATRRRAAPPAVPASGQAPCRSSRLESARRQRDGSRRTLETEKWLQCFVGQWWVSFARPGQGLPGGGRLEKGVSGPPAGVW